MPRKRISDRDAKGRAVLQSSDQTARTILVVEDDCFIRTTIAEYLHECGWHVVEAETATEAVAILKSNNTTVDLVFSDIQMPGAMDGFGLAAWIRQHLPGVRIILTSGDVKVCGASTELCDEGPILKPYDQRRLVERIRFHLQGN
mgnify:CR=1 FL=1